MLVKNWRREVFTIPNMLSLFRLLLIPVYITLYLNAETQVDYYVSAGVLAVSCLTDMIDGQIARRCHMISTVGKVLDPVADKATQFSLIICLALRYPILWYLVVLFVVKEFFQLVAGIVLFRKGMILRGALIGGKVSTAILFLSLIIMVMLPNLSETAVNIIVITDIAFVLIAFADYAIAYYRKDSKFQSVEESFEKDV